MKNTIKHALISDNQSYYICGNILIQSNPQNIYDKMAISQLPKTK